MSSTSSLSSLDLLFIFYFITHIPITLCIDIQAISPTIIDLQSYIPSFLLNAKNLHIQYFGDDMMNNPPLWFSVAVFIEVIFQIPYFIYAIHGFINRDNSIRTPTIVYCTHVLTVVTLILPELYIRCTSPYYHIRILLVALYSIYWIIPALLLYRTLNTDNMFNQSKNIKTH